METKNLCRDGRDTFFFPRVVACEASGRMVDIVSIVHIFFRKWCFRSMKMDQFPPKDDWILFYFFVRYDGECDLKGICFLSTSMVMDFCRKTSFEEL